MLPGPGSQPVNPSDANASPIAINTAATEFRRPLLALPPYRVLQRLHLGAARTRAPAPGWDEETVLEADLYQNAFDQIEQAILGSS